MMKLGVVYKKREKNAREAGWATRDAIRGCPACQRHSHTNTVAQGDVCKLCDGWQFRGRRGIVQLAKPGCVNRRLCGSCGGGVGQNKTIRPAATPALRRQMHATLYDDRAGRMTQGSGCVCVSPTATRFR